MQVFKDNPFPEHLFHKDYPNGLYVSDKKELAEALAKGFSRTYIPREYPKWVGPHDKQEVIPQADGKGGTYHDIVMVPQGGKICQNKEEEDAHLALLASQGKRGPGRPKAEAAA